MDAEDRAGTRCDAILYPYWPSPPLRRRGAPPAAVFVHDLAFRMRPQEVPWQQRLYFRALLPPALRNAAAVLVPSESARQDLLDLYRVGGLESRVEVIPEGLPPAVPPGPLPEGLEPGFILAVGTIEPRKNYPRLLMAFRRMRGRQGSLPFIINGRPGVPQLVIAGRPGWAYGDTLQRIAAEPGVRYLGHVDEPTLSALYEAASVLAYPSLYEGFGLPLLEAMARGLPAVVGAAGALPELAWAPRSPSNRMMSTRSPARSSACSRTPRCGTSLARRVAVAPRRSRGIAPP